MAQEAAAALSAESTTRVIQLFVKRITARADRPHETDTWVLRQAGSKVLAGDPRDVIEDWPTFYERAALRDCV